MGAIMVRLEAGTAASASAASAASLFLGEEGLGEEGGNTSSSSSSLDGGLARMYVMTVGVLAPWRGKGIGELEEVEEFFFSFLSFVLLFSSEFFFVSFSLFLTLSSISTSQLLPAGTTLLTNALSMASQDDGVGTAYLHAHVSNSEALSFYQKRLGFRKGATAKGYYRRLSPPDAVVLWRRLR